MVFSSASVPGVTIMRTCDCYGKFGIGDVSVATLSNMVRSLLNIL